MPIDQQALHYTALRTDKPYADMYTNPNNLLC